MSKGSQNWSIVWKPEYGCTFTPHFSGSRLYTSNALLWHNLSTQDDTKYVDCFWGKVCGSPYLQPRYLHSIAALDNLRYTCCLDRIQEPAIEIFMNLNTFINDITEKEAPAALLCCKSFLTRSVPSQVFGEPSPPESTPTSLGHPGRYFYINVDV